MGTLLVMSTLLFLFVAFCANKRSRRFFNRLVQKAQQA